MKKRVGIFLVFFCTINYAHGQEKKYYIGAHYSFGSHNYWEDNASVGSYSKQEGTNYFDIGFDYKYRTSENMEILLGLTATLYSYRESTAYSKDAQYEKSFAVFSLPIHVKLHFLRYFFIGGGFNFSKSIRRVYSNKGGIGFELNAGAEYSFKSGLAVSVTPLKQWDFFNLPSDTFTQQGISIGVGYRFGGAKTEKE
jgi:hypothetical protein